MISLRVSASPREESVRRSPLLLRLEVRQRNTRLRAVALVVIVPVLILASLGFGQALAAIGPLKTFAMVAMACGVGFCLHKLTHPLL